MAASSADPRADPVRLQRSRFAHLVDEERAAEAEAERQRLASLGPPPPESPPRPRRQHALPAGVTVLEGRGGPALR